MCCSIPDISHISHFSFIKVAHKWKDWGILQQVLQILVAKYVSVILPLNLTI